MRFMREGRERLEAEKYQVPRAVLKEAAEHEIDRVQRDRDLTRRQRAEMVRELQKDLPQVRRGIKPPVDLAATTARIDGLATGLGILGGGFGMLANGISEFISGGKEWLDGIASHVLDPSKNGQRGRTVRRIRWARRRMAQENRRSREGVLRVRARNVMHHGLR